jgi:hypothetical protein
MADFNGGAASAVHPAPPRPMSICWRLVNTLGFKNSFESFTLFLLLKLCTPTMRRASALEYVGLHLEIQRAIPFATRKDERLRLSPMSQPTNAAGNRRDHPESELFY